MKIENAVLNEKLIKEIEVLQQENNVSITLYLERLTEAIDYLLEESENANPETEKHMLILARELTYIKGILRKMKA